MRRQPKLLSKRVQSENHVCLDSRFHGNDGYTGIVNVHNFDDRIGISKIF